MAQLINKTKKNVIASELKIASNFFSRLKGLMFKDKLEESEALLIPNCNSIHTFLMNMSIDALFVDKDNRVQKIIPNLQPNKIILPVWKASHVLELKSGTCKKSNIEVGDILHVEN